MHRGLMAVVVTLVAGCSETAPKPAAAEESVAVERFLANFADSALAKYDTAAIGRGLADDFAILEDSVWYDREGYLSFMAAFPATVGGSVSVAYQRSDFHTTVDDDHAWTSFVSLATMELPDSARAKLGVPVGVPLTKRYRETVILRRSGTDWKVVHWRSATIG